MNNITLAATLTTDPELRYTNDGQTPIAKFAIQFPGYKDDDPLMSLEVVAWGNLAQSLQEAYKSGDCVILEGSLRMNTIEKEGYKEKVAELQVNRIHSVGGVSSDRPVSTPTATPQKAKTANYAPTATKGRNPSLTQVTEPDYDDIPF